MEIQCIRIKRSHRMRLIEAGCQRDLDPRRRNWWRLQETPVNTATDTLAHMGKNIPTPTPVIQNRIAKILPTAAATHMIWVQKGIRDLGYDTMKLEFLANEGFRCF